jgi:hypothetical protein
MYPSALETSDTLYHCHMLTMGVIMLHGSTSPDVVTTLEHAVPDLIEYIVSPTYCLYLSPLTFMYLYHQEYFTGSKI